MKKYMYSVRPYVHLGMYMYMYYNLCTGQSFYIDYSKIEQVPLSAIEEEGWLIIKVYTALNADSYSRVMVSYSNSTYIPCS